jgi:hypothetical protein
MLRSILINYRKGRPEIKETDCGGIDGASQCRRSQKGGVPMRLFMIVALAAIGVGFGAIPSAYAASIDLTSIDRSASHTAPRYYHRHRYHRHYRWSYGPYDYDRPYYGRPFFPFWW